jgi:hypothetical protein
VEQVFHIFGYFKKIPKKRIVFDPDYPAKRSVGLKRYDWAGIYRDCKELTPPNAPTHLGKPVSIDCFVNETLAGIVVTRRSQTGILIFLSRAPVVWHCKKHKNVESSPLGCFEECD